ncbi:MAG: DUF2927 domain-containing protein [Pseudomonadota bacterium]
MTVIHSRLRDVSGSTQAGNVCPNRVRRTRRRIRRHVGLALLLGLLGAVTTPASLAADPPTLYQQAVHILGGNGNVVSRWHDALRVAIVGLASPEEAIGIVASAAGLARLSYSVTKAPAGDAAAYNTLLQDTPAYALGADCAAKPSHGQCPNLVIIETDNPTMQALSTTIPMPGVHLQALRRDPDLECFFYAFRDGRLRIRQAVVYVRSGLSDAMRKTCLNEEIYQAFGMFGDYTNSVDFSFNNVVAPKALTRFDQLLLQALYDDRVKAGYPVHHVATVFLDYVRNAGLEVR